MTAKQINWREPMTPLSVMFAAVALLLVSFAYPAAILLSPSVGGLMAGLSLVSAFASGRYFP